MARILLAFILAAGVAMIAPACPSLCEDPVDEFDGNSDDSSDRFRVLNARADEAAEQGDFQSAIRLWQEAIPYDQSPYVECRGALQRVYIRVAEHVVSMVNNGTLDDDAAFEWFKSRASNVWGNSTCNSP